jgi:ubiquinone/menaquinone biosynthesis C-methylase UbiE
MLAYWSRRATVALLLGAVLPLWAQEAPVEERKPARILPAEMAHILLSEGREELEQPEKTLDAMQLKDGDLVADIGCGNGFYSLRVAERVGPHGHVLAVDIQQGMLDQLEQRMDEAGIQNIYPILGAPEDPHLPTGKVDWVLMVDVYHEFSDPKPMLARIKECLAPDGKVALLEYRAEQDPSTMPPIIPPDHKMSVEQVLKEWLPAGFELVQQHDFLPAQHVFVFKAAD